MKLEGDGILISLRPFGERDCIAHIFTYQHGIVCGMIRGGLASRTNRPMVGQIGIMRWGARLDSQLGVIHWEATKNLAATLIMTAKKLNLMNAAFGLIDTLLPERAQYETLYTETVNLLTQLASDDDTTDYLKWEIGLLRDLGYALDLSKCSGCGRQDNLNYLSPRTGRAVCNVCAAPYINKLYTLPLNLNVTLRFIDAICIQQGTNLPLARKMLKTI